MSAVLGPQDHADMTRMIIIPQVGDVGYSQLTIRTLVRCTYGLVSVCYLVAGTCIRNQN